MLPALIPCENCYFSDHLKILFSLLLYLKSFQDILLGDLSWCPFLLQIRQLVVIRLRKVIFFFVMGGGTMNVSQHALSVRCAVCISYGWLGERSRVCFVLFFVLFLRKKAVMFEEIFKS